MNIVIETDRLLLRTFTREDASLIYELNRDPEVTRYTCDPIFDLLRAQKVLEETILPQYTLCNYGRWAVHLRANPEFIGWCGLKFRPERNEVELGYRFLKNWWGKGFATEAARASLQHGFKKLSLEQIVARALPANTASIRVLEKCGMEYRDEEFIDGHLHKTYQAWNPAINE